ncbi:MAG: NifB/NifX family molybdenum-iron cluster-binding protein [Bryobacteraceae bacterium]
MKIAVPTDDGTSIAGHFGRCASFLIFDADGEQIRSKEMRADAAHHVHDRGGSQSSDAHEVHNHDGILMRLSGCDVVLCGGMGWRAAEALKSAGIAIVLAGETASAEAAVRSYLRGEFAPSLKGFCSCKH